MKQTVLITGGTGLVGKALTNALVEKGYKVIILTRDIKGKKQGEKITYAKWDVEKQEIDIDALQQADHIIHLAGAPVVEKKWTAAYKKEIRDSRIESSRLMIAALKNNENKVRAIVSASAIGWYGADVYPVTPFTEDDAADGSFLGQTCKLWEAGIEPVTGLGKRLVKLRIGIVLSNDGGALVEFKKPLRFRIAAILGNGKQVTSWIHIDDLCNMLIAGIENENLSGSYNAVAPNPVSNKELTLTLAKAIRGKFFLALHVPSFVLKTMMGESSIEVLKSTTVSCKKIQDAGFKFTFKTIEASIKDFVTATDRH
ncbi:MAG: TIGR01777 family oxidoreductase [Ferruginibacter sp.]|nr:TIGR01777 family oxidoreductase [Ferruginibacter sp.]